MTLLNEILNSQNGAIVEQVAGLFGLDQGQAQSAISALVPALARGVRNNAQSGNGLQSLLGALQGGGHEKWLDQPERLQRDEAVDEGNAILGHVLGSKDVSRNVASHASTQTGLSEDLIKKILPIVATAVMSALSKKMLGGDQPAGQQNAMAGGLGGLVGGLLGGGGAASLLGAGGGNEGNGGQANLMGMLGGFLDADDDGSMMDDVLGMLSRK